ncbi:uncharacterized [Tachysurus ichikawai]
MQTDECRLFEVTLQSSERASYSSSSSSSWLRPTLRFHTEIQALPWKQETGMTGDVMRTDRDCAEEGSPPAECIT